MEFEDKVMDLINIIFGAKDFNEFSSKIYDVMMSSKNFQLEINTAIYL